MKKEKKTRRISFGTIIWSVIPAIALVAVAGFAGLSIARHVYPPIVPVSGTSMTPLLHFGDLVLLKKADYGHLQKGDIIAFRTTTDVQLKWNVPGSYVHRIIEVQKGAYGQQFQTQGDNVAGKDPFWTVEQNVIGVYAGKINGLGYPVLFLRSRQGKILLGGILLIAFLYWLLGIFERRRTAEAVNVQNLASVVDEARRITQKMEEAAMTQTSAQVVPASPPTLRPKDWLIAGDFLTGTISMEAPAEIFAAQKIALALEEGLQGSNWPSYDVAYRAQVPIPTLASIVEGEIIPEFATLARLGKVLGISSWTTD
jgi:signal peptidase I